MDHTNKKEKEEFLKRTDEDIAFQERIENFHPAVLSMWISMGVSGRDNREWLINYLNELEEFLKELGIIEDTVTKDIILRTVKEQIVKHEAEFGSAELNPKRLDTWTHEIANLTDDAQIHAKFGRDTAALNKMVDVLREGIRCLEYFIDQQAEIGIPGLEAALNKTAGDAQTSPAANDSIIPNNRDN